MNNMLKEKQLHDDLTTVKVNNYSSIVELKQMLETISSENQIPMQIEKDTIKVGGLFNSRELDCLVIKHPEHTRDYFQIVVVPNGGQANIATIGTSKQMKKFATADALKTSRKGKPLSFKIGNAVAGSLFLIGKSKNKLEIEQKYYDAVLEIIGYCLQAE